MKILRPGSQEKIDKIKYFECSNCGAIWSATKDEYTSDSQYNEEIYYCKCPTENCPKEGREINKDSIANIIAPPPMINTPIFRDTHDSYWNKLGTNNC